MNKEKLQKEIKEKVKPGVKPSDLKKLKRSKSADDIPNAPASVPLTKSQSNPPLETKYPYTTLISQQQELDRLQKETETKSTTISLLRKKIDELEKNNPPHILLQDQLQEKQKQIESLTQDLDNSLFARQQAVKQFGQIHDQLQKVKQELDENVDQASTELVSQDDQISR